VEELLAVPVPVLVVQGERDPFGAPGELPEVADVVAVPGDHSLRAGAAQAAAAVVGWLDQRVT
jgi:predicted alpha/beta-hydrolase family hydrolase